MLDVAFFVDWLVLFNAVVLLDKLIVRLAHQSCVDCWLVFNYESVFLFVMCLFPAKAAGFICDRCGEDVWLLW